MRTMRVVSTVTLTSLRRALGVCGCAGVGPGRTLAPMVESAAELSRGGDARRRRVVGAAPWVLVLVAVGAVQAVRAQWVDAALFLAVATALALDAAGVFDGLRRRIAARTAKSDAATGVRTAPGRLARAAAWAGIVLAAVVLVSATRHGPVAGLVALVLGVLAVVIAWTPAPPSMPNPPRRGARRRAAVLWASVVVAAAVWELATFVIGRIAPPVRPDFPSVSEIVDPILDQPIGRAVFVAVWLGLGGFLLTRARVRASRSAGRVAIAQERPVATDAADDLEP